MRHKIENSFSIKRAYLFSIIIAVLLFTSVLIKSENAEKKSNNSEQKVFSLSNYNEAFMEEEIVFVTTRPTVFHKIDEIKSTEFIEKKDCFLLTTFTGASRGISTMSESFSAMTGEIFKLKISLEKLNGINL